MKKYSNEEIIPLNNGLIDEMFLHELGTRLETDPLVPNGLLELVGENQLDALCVCYEQSTYVENCTCYSHSTYVS